MKTKVVVKKIKGGTQVSHYAKEGEKIFLHKEDGPALQYLNERGNVENEYWFINGERLTNTQIKEQKKKLGIL